MKIRTRTPTRIDLAGGTLDLWPLYLLFEEARTINVAIDLCASVTIEPSQTRLITIRSVDQQKQVQGSLEQVGQDKKLPLLSRLIRHFAPDCGFAMETNSMVPAGSGLGGSSSLAIAAGGALNELTGKGYSREEMVAMARDVEAQVLGIPTGEQDYYAAVWGGANSWHFRVGRVVREPYPFPIDQLEQRLLLFYTGVPRFSGINNWQVYKNCIDGDSRTRSALNAIREESEALHRSLLDQKWQGVYDAIEREWEARRALAEHITTPQIEELIAFGKSHGAKAGRVCGAGGGGCVVLVTEPENKSRLSALCKEKGFQVLDFKAVEHGLEVTGEP